MTGDPSSNGDSPPRDVVLVTVDCWRHDAPERMPNLRRMTAGFERGEAICQAAATNGVFPAILASRYVHDAYSPPDFDSVAADVVPLPTVLSDAGYETSAFVGSNPFLGKWEPYFDTFWNDGMRARDEERNRSTYTQFDRAKNLLTLEPRVTATEVATRARDWFESTDRPRFLWMHLMDTHGPYYPGLRRGRETGLFGVYRSLLRYARQGMAAPDGTLDTIRELYWQCVERLDEQIPTLLGFLPDDATVVVTADHGEELHHGYIGHARLYDECVRVPLFVRHHGGPTLDAPLRQLDLAPTLAEWVGAEPPESWHGDPYDGAPRESFQVNRSYVRGEERLYTGLRTETAKLIEWYDASGRKMETELYDLVSDPEERTPLEVRELAGGESLEQRLSAFRRRTGPVETLHSSRPEASSSVRRRLDELGYR